jgi:hypothetical protein
MNFIKKKLLCDNKIFQIVNLLPCKSLTEICESRNSFNERELEPDGSLQFSQIMAMIPLSTGAQNMEST